MSVPVQSSRTGRRLNASGRARRAKRAAARRRRQMLLSGAIAITAVIAAPLSVASYLGVETTLPGIASAKSFLAMMAERSPGDRTKAELKTTKHRPAAAPKQRALGKITPPPPPKEFVEAIAPPPPKVAEGVPLAMAPTTLGPLLVTPSTPGGIAIPPQSPPPGGGGGGPTPPPSEEPPVTQPPPPVGVEPTITQPPPPGDDEPPPTPPVVPEPGTWATMLLGVGLSGLLMRRRRRKTALA
jgi:hypothetical protein